MFRFVVAGLVEANGERLYGPGMPSLHKGHDCAAVDATAKEGAKRYVTEHLRSNAGGQLPVQGIHGL